MNVDYNFTLGDIPSSNNDFQNNGFYLDNRYSFKCERRFSDDFRNLKNLDTRVQQDTNQVNELDDAKTNYQNIIINDSGEKVLIEEQKGESISKFISKSFVIPDTSIENNNEKELLAYNDNVLRRKIKLLDEMDEINLVNHFMEEDDFNDNNIDNGNEALSQLPVNVIPYNDNTMLSEPAVSETVKVIEYENKYSLPTSSSTENGNRANYALPSSIDQNKMIDNTGKLNIPEPAAVKVRKANEQEYRNEIENPDFFSKIFSEFIERNHVTSPGQVKKIRKHFFQKPNGAVYTIPTDADKKEIEERLKGNFMPPQPEYFNPCCTSLGYKCLYDVEHPHPYINPFEMFVYVDNNNVRRKLKKCKKYSVSNLSNGRIICLACALLHKKKIGKASRLQDWDVIDTNGNGVRKCSSCKKYKKVMHYNQKRYHKQCTFCASHRTYSREKKDSDNG